MLTALVAAMSFPDKLAELGQFPDWLEAGPLPLE
jgi:hypothetical protein